MVIAITRKDLEEEFQTFSNTVQLELRVEFVKLSKRLENLEQLCRQPMHINFPHSAEQPQSESPYASYGMHRDASGDEAGKEASRATARTSTTSARRSWINTAVPLRAMETQEDFTDHYFRTFATGAEARHWQDEEMEPQGPTASEPMNARKSIKRFLNSGKARTLAFQEELNGKQDPEQAPGKRRVFKKTTIKAKAEQIVTSPLFNGVIATFIFLNAVTLGVQTDHMAQQKLTTVPKVFKVIELTFCGIFTLEIILKLVAHRWWFFKMSGWKWNVFDFFLVVMTIMEEVLDTIVDFSYSNFSAIRVLRILRVVRIVRVIRLLRMIGELRAIVASVLGSIRALGWTVLLLLSIIYIIATYFTQLLIEARISGTDDSSLVEYKVYYGSLARSILTLYESVSGGIDWDVAVMPLIQEIGPFFGVLFALYIAFTVLAIMNVVTGVFVESALLSAREDKDIYIVNHVRELIEQMTAEGGDESGIISWELFQSKLDSQEMHEVFKHVDVDITEAAHLFRLLDLNDNGVVHSEEFLDGILRLRGPAKALDLALMMREIKRLTLKVQQMVGLWASAVSEIQESPLRHAAAASQEPIMEDRKRNLKASIISDLD